MLPSSTKDVGEVHSAQHAVEKAKNRKMFLLMLTNVQFLARQGLAQRGDGNECNSNFTQLIHLRRNECAGIDVNAWLDRRANKYTSPEVQNECLQLMSLHILRKVSKAIAIHVHTVRSYFCWGQGGGEGGTGPTADYFARPTTIGLLRA